ncbi:MAG: hypothetical protein V3V08_10325 [Nannocystaceae bacterium]
MNAYGDLPGAQGHGKAVLSLIAIFDQGVFVLVAPNVSPDIGTQGPEPRSRIEWRQ